MSIDLYEDQPHSCCECNDDAIEQYSDSNGDLVWFCEKHWQAVCEHEFDPDEGFMCLECGKQGEPSDLYDEDYGKER